MEKKIYITPKQYGALRESEFNFHFGSNHDMRPYGSDTKYRMAGRETGHFGSGTYFSTYRDNAELEPYRDGSTKDFRSCFIQVADHIYRVDFDLYKNLYRVRTKRQGDVLYTMMADLNHMANRIAYMGHFSKDNANYNNADLYQRIKSNAEGLGLRCPSYYELTRMAQNHGKDDNIVQSFSTLFMEWNGYNGVNVSGVEYYDNTKHGSVIYDLSKTNTKMEEVRPKSLYTGFKDSPYDDSVVQNGFSDPRIESLKGEYIGWYDKLNDLSMVEALRLLKNYADSGHILSYFTIKELKPELIKRYLRLIYVKRPRTYWGNAIDDEMLSGDYAKYYTQLIDEYKAYYWVNYESGKKYNSVLINLLNNFTWNLSWDLTSEEERKKKEEYLNMLMSYMQRDLTEYEQRYIKEDYFEEDEDIEQQN